MNTTATFFIAAFFFSLALGVPFITRQACSEDRDCLLGFPSTVGSLVCSKGQGICVAKHPHYCHDSHDCKEALTTCVAHKCSYGAEGAPCTVRADCGVGHFCSSAGRCQHGKPGDSCSRVTAVQCYNGLTCGEDEKCRPGLFNERCVLDRNCVGGLYCNKGRCDGGTRPASPKLNPWTYTAPDMHPIENKPPQDHRMPRVLGKPAFFEQRAALVEPSFAPLALNAIPEPSAEPAVTAIAFAATPKKGSGSSELIIAMPSDTPVPSIASAPAESATSRAPVASATVEPAMDSVNNAVVVTIPEVEPSAGPVAPTPVISPTKTPDAVELNAFVPTPVVSPTKTPDAIVPKAFVPTPVVSPTKTPDAVVAKVFDGAADPSSGTVMLVTNIVNPEPTAQAELVEPIGEAHNAEAGELTGPVTVEVTAVPIPVKRPNRRQDVKATMAPLQADVVISS